MASHGLFDRFRKRTGIHLVVRHGEVASSNKKAADKFLKKYEELISREDNIPQQVFNYDENALFWKKMRRLLGNALAHPPGLKANIHSDFSFIKVLCLPPNTTPLLQPMDQQVIANFKKRYTKHLFRRCFKVTESTQLTLRDFWNGHFDIVQCLKRIDKAWNEVSRHTLNFSWKKLWPPVVAEREFEGFEPSTENEAVNDLALKGYVKEIISIGRSVGLVDEADIDNLIEEHKEELTTEDLKKLGSAVDYHSRGAALL
ncbi:tigger transposable element-derived protein 1-like [Palaemon carinicauda]|uniref:tigger transposable element-derived protein 1-like n=1 Tax=Palaemon carinicauda TaxID=392227 RepID=UPI0035B61AB1